VIACCPTCGGTLTEALPAGSLAGIFTGVFAAIVEHLAQRAGRWVTSQALAAVVYADRPDGGPDDACGSIRVTISKNRHRVLPLGWRIEGHNGPGGGYRLVLA
jgi:hypothetical protein